MSAPRLALRNLGKSFGPVQAAENISFTVTAGEIRALCGHNGAGKSTVLNMLAGIVAPDHGEIEIDGATQRFRDPRDAQRAGVARVDQELSVIGALTVAENIALAGAARRRRGGRARSAHVRELLSRVGLHDVDPSQPLRTLSLGQRQLVEIARALGAGSRVLILDEPTATLNALEIEHVFTAVRHVAESGCAVLFVSHRLGEVLALCDRVTVMRDGRCTLDTETRGVTSTNLIEAMLGEVPESAASEPPATAADTPQLRIRGLAVPGRVEGFSQPLLLGRVYGLAGQVGSGATEVLRALAGLEPQASGVAHLAGRRLPLGRPRACARHGIAYASNDRRNEGLFPTRTVTENLTASRLGSLRSNLGRSGGQAVRAAARPLAAMAQLPPDRLEGSVSELSGGNQQKVLIARSLQLPQVQALLIDEPTRGVDVAGRSAIHRLLRQAAQAGLLVVFASTELEELDELANSIITMRSGRVIGTYDSGVSKQQILEDLTHRELAA